MRQAGNVQETGAEVQENVHSKEASCATCSLPACQDGVVPTEVYGTALHAAVSQDLT